MASRNRTIELDAAEEKRLAKGLLTLKAEASVDAVLDRTIQQDIFKVIPYLPDSCVDLLFVDPPYNLTKNFNGKTFKGMDDEDYEDYVASWLEPLVRCLKPDANVYICGDWVSSSAIYRVGRRHFKVNSRITWEREKGRDAKSNWKNASEDIWFFSQGTSYFDVDAVKLRRRVIAPYREKGEPKDWEETEKGNFRLTHPSNLWTDLSVPFWSMPENTEHPTQKPEKLLAKVILSSCPAGGVVLDPFLGSGTTSVVAKKLGRHYIGIERDRRYACLAEKRLEQAESDKSIQGYHDDVFWERNTMPTQGARNGRSR